MGWFKFPENIVVLIRRFGRIFFSILWKGYPYNYLQETAPLKYLYLDYAWIMLKPVELGFLVSHALILKYLTHR